MIFSLHGPLLPSDKFRGLPWCPGQLSHTLSAAKNTPFPGSSPTGQGLWWFFQLWTASWLGPRSTGWCGWSWRRPETRGDARKSLRLETWENDKRGWGGHGKAAIRGRAACGRNVDFPALNVAFTLGLWPLCPTVGSQWQGIEVS